MVFSFSFSIFFPFLQKLLPIFRQYLVKNRAHISSHLNFIRRTFDSLNNEYIKFELIFHLLRMWYQKKNVFVHLIFCLVGFDCHDHLKKVLGHFWAQWENVKAYRILNKKRELQIENTHDNLSN